MARGGKQPGAGRPVGAVSKSTAQAREAIAAFVDGNAERLTGWLDQMAVDSPKDAFNCFMSVVEYHIPKLARTEVSGVNGGAITTATIDLTEAEKKRIEAEINEQFGSLPASENKVSV